MLLSTNIRTCYIDAYNYRNNRYKNIPAEYKEFGGKSVPNDTANGITKFIIDICNWYSEKLCIWAIRVNNIPRAVGVNNGKIKYAYSNTQKGVSDIIIVWLGFAYFIEVKAGNDRQSDEQKKFQIDIEMARGEYIIIRSRLEFITFINENLKKTSI